MKKLLIIILTLILCITGCKSGPSESELLQQEYEENGFIFVKVEIVKGGTLFSDTAKGYISQEELDLYFNNKLEDSILKINHPYERNKFVMVNINDVAYIYTP